MSPNCGNCGEHVTQDNVRVRAPDGYDTVRCCPNCEKKREKGEIRDYAHK